MARSDSRKKLCISCILYGRTGSGARHELVTGLKKKQAMYMARRFQGILETATRPGEEADHRGAGMGGVDLTAADLKGVVLKQAHPSEADVENADRREASLIGVEVTPE